MANLDQLIYRIVPDETRSWSSSTPARSSCIDNMTGISATRVDEALGFDGRSRARALGAQSWTHIDLKQWDHLRMTKVRQALDFATPSQDIIDKLFKGRTLSDVADQLYGFVGRTRVGPASTLRPGAGEVVVGRG